MARKVFTYKDVEEAKKYFGKFGIFSSNYRDICNGLGYKGSLCRIDGDFPFVPSPWGLPSNYQFFSPDPEPVEKWVPFTAEDWALFIGKPITNKGCTWFLLILSFSEFEVDIRSMGACSFPELLDKWEFLDGSPCGKKFLTESQE